MQQEAEFHIDVTTRIEQGLMRSLLEQALRFSGVMI